MSIYYNLVSDTVLEEIKQIVGSDNVLVDTCDLVCYARDHSPTKYCDHFKYKPEVVVLPKNTNEVQQIVELAFRERIPVSPWGGGTGFTGNAVPKFGGIVVDMKKMNKVLEIDEDSLLVTVEAGIELSVLDEELQKHGFICGDDPTSFHMATVGGRIATNGAGIRMFKYGAAMDQLIGLEVVLPNGSLLTVGGGGGIKIAKSSVGYPLRQLFCGSQGTLGIITKVVIKIFPTPEEIFPRIFFFNSFGEALSTAIKLAKRGISVISVLFVSTEHTSVSERRFGHEVETPVGPSLAIALEGTKAEVEAAKNLVFDIIQREGGQDLGSSAGESFWKNRYDFFIAHTLLDKSFWYGQEPGVPLAVSKKTIEKMLDIIRESGIPDSKIYECALFGVLPPVITITTSVDEKDDQKWANYQKMCEEIARLVINMGGTCSGGHGLGFRRLDSYVAKELGTTAFNLMKGIKEYLDPRFIMNPGKLGLGPSC